MNNIEKKYLVNLGEENSLEIAMVGGKGASLGKLVKEGFPIPISFKIRFSISIIKKK